ncbi:hypothetical protein NECAME_16210 [Necator americanus]|uniref:Uncharacterized protein n=1 Tax=Necator americanus TaxID=51031 RepID=W2TXR3_NECAM|nr:hypothetical protein NECAME_16210 [Necator americanus]ETN86658.1 hypothetical protein NECAME_16210 [Necator americanus]
MDEHRRSLKMATEKKGIDGGCGIRPVHSIPALCVASTSLSEDGTLQKGEKKGDGNKEESTGLIKRS